jgi:hypothetical protein
MAGSKMSFSYDAIGSEILRADFMVAHMKDRAERMLTAAWDRAPVYAGDDKDEHRGRYRASLRVETTSHGGAKGNRASASVVADSPEAVFVEFGHRAHGKIPAQDGQHVLGSALMAAAGDE